MATLRGDATPLGGNKSTSDKGAAQSALVELTSLEWENEVSEGTLDKALTQCLTSCTPLGWVDGVLQPLPMVVPQPTLQGLETGDETGSLSDEEVH